MIENMKPTQNQVYMPGMTFLDWTLPNKWTENYHKHGSARMKEWSITSCTSNVCATWPYGMSFIYLTIASRIGKYIPAVRNGISSYKYTYMMDWFRIESWTFVYLDVAFDRLVLRINWN